MQTISSAQASPEVIINENFEVLGHVELYARSPVTSSGLTWGYSGGRWNGSSISAGTLTLTASTYNYIVIHRNTGVISTSTSTTNWDNTRAYARAYLVLCSTTSPSSIEDHRAGPHGVYGTVNQSLFSTSTTTSGTSVDITSLPATATEIEITFSGVSTSGTSQVLVQLGDSGGVETTGYTAACGNNANGTMSVNTSTAGFPVGGVLAADARVGRIKLVLTSSNTWVAEGTMLSNGTTVSTTVGTKQTSATLDRVRITTVGGSDTFDAGSLVVHVK